MALTARSIPIDPALMTSEDMTEHSGFRAASRPLQSADPPTAFLAASMLSGMGVRRAIEARGLKMGRDVSVIIFDDELSYLKNGAGESNTETGYIASSRFYYKINDNVFFTNDTDVLNSDTALRANNDFGVNFKVTDAISTRVSYLTEYNDSRAIRTDNKLGVSLVFGF